MLRFFAKLGLICSVILGVFTGIAVYGEMISTWSILYVADENGAWVIYESDIDRQLTREPFSGMRFNRVVYSERTPSVSSNGRYIIYGDTTQTTITDTATNAEHSFDANFTYLLSPNNRYLLLHAETNWRLIEISEDGTFGEAQIIIPDLYIPSNAYSVWSPNSDMIVFETNETTVVGRYDIYLYSLEGQTIENLTFDPSVSLNRDPVWSPDGGSIVYLAGTAPGDHLVRVNVDGSNRQQLTLSQVPLGAMLEMQWSPDGRYLALVVRGLELFIMPTDGTGTMIGPLDQGVGAVDVRWSNDSQRLVFVSNVTRALYTVDINGDNLTRLTTDEYRHVLLR